MKTTSIFPLAETADENGMVAYGGEIHPRTLLDAYQNGIFPWPQEDYPVLWFSPDPRGVLDLKDMHVARSLQKIRKQVAGEWRFSFNEAFREVITACAKAPRGDHSGTWITGDLLEGYEAFFREGKAYSVEAWKGSELVGGLYGVKIDSFWSAESMFYREDNASKLCLWFLLEDLKARGVSWLDIQMVTPVSESFGGKYISRGEFLHRLKAIWP